MIGRKGLRFGIIAAVVGAAVSAGLLASTAFAQGPSVGIGNGTAEPGGQGTADISAGEIADPGLGAWTLTLAYDSTVVSVVDCLAADVGLNQCNPDFDPDTDPNTPNFVRVAGADANGVTGSFVLATITFQCVDPTAEVDGALTLTADTFADATVGAPADINPTVNNGTFSCAIQPTATNTTVPPTGIPPAATSTVGAVAGTGTGGPTDSDNTAWVVAALAGAGLAAFAAMGALRLRSRRA